MTFDETVGEMVERRGLTEHDAAEVARFRTHLQRTKGLAFKDWPREEQVYAIPELEPAPPEPTEET